MDVIKYFSVISLHFVSSPISVETILQRWAMKHSWLHPSANSASAFLTLYSKYCKKVLGCYNGLSEQIVHITICNSVWLFANLSTRSSNPAGLRFVKFNSSVS